MTGSDPAQPLTHNPYVGPRTFTEAEGDYFFGREREAGDLVSLVLAERLVLFYAQSGAGKSSLINTRLIPNLRDEEGFEVLPVGRVSGELPAGLSPQAVDNIFIFNLNLCLADQAQTSSLEGCAAWPRSDWPTSWATPRPSRRRSPQTTILSTKRPPTCWSSTSLRRY